MSEFRSIGLERLQPVNDNETISGTSQIRPFKDYPLLRFPPGKLLFRYGDRAESLVLILRGAVTVARYAGDHENDQYMEIASSPTLLGEESLIDDRRYQCEAKTLTICYVQKIRPYDIWPLLKDPIDGKSLFLAALKQAADLRLHPGFTRSTAPVKVETLLQQLLTIHRRSPIRRLYQDELGMLVGTSREAINKALAEKPESKKMWQELEPEGKKLRRVLPKRS